ncbi:MAG TPA: AAA family ATPase [Fulvivirga sp.]|nr:AAA family ATPase [Fulvivirga sp.]
MIPEQPIEQGIKEEVNKIDALIANIEKVIRGHHEQVVQVVTCLLAKGHILLEDNPGSGKTVMAKSLAGSLSQSGSKGKAHADFKRIQFTPDLLPMDLIGTHIYDESKKDFIFKNGPLFSNILLADEINRASPKVQSALLECMAEQQITAGDQTYVLEKPFFVIATQNPIEMEGTYPLPNAQLDRFFMKVGFGYVTEEVELDIYKQHLEILNFQENIQPVMELKDILELQKEAEEIFIHEEIIKSVNKVIRSTREHSGITLGASIRSGIILLKCMRAYALINKRNYVIEDDLAGLIKPVLQHRLLFKNKNAEGEALDSIVKIEIKRLAKLDLSGK